MRIPGYSIDAALHTGAAFVLVRARRASDEKPVLLKLVRDGSPLERGALEREYALVSGLAVEGVLPALALFSYDEGAGLALEDAGGALLRQHLQAGGLGLAASLGLAVQVASVLEALHRQQVVHGALCPDTLLVAPDGERTWLLGFDQALRLQDDDGPGALPAWQEERLPYIAPEQTGRTNRPVDHRTDLYALGATLYEMLTGRPPFEVADPLELVHAHLARLPAAPADVEPSVPRAVSDVVMKLLAKTAEERYQSALGLKRDLEACLRQWNEEGTVAPFALGRHDVPDRFEIPEKLYGREQEVEQLVAAFQRVRAGATGVVLVSGYSGVGKTSLINAIYDTVVRQGGYFIGGKFDQFDRSLPYSALIQAFQERVRQILSEPEEQIQAWKARLLAALEPNSQVILDVIPELALIIGPQPPVPRLEPAEAQNRFDLYVQRFMGAFAQQEHPVLLFLDDLQWADAASLNLIRTLVTAGEAGCFLLVGAYRDNEVSTHHPLMHAVREIKQAGTHVAEISLPPLARSCVVQLVSEALRCGIEAAGPLAGLVHQKTGGNPFFTRAFLKSLYDEGLLHFEPEGGWHWDLGLIGRRRATDNVVALMARKIGRLAPETRAVLRLAACIGGRFDVATLATVYEHPADETVACLDAAATQELVVPDEGGYAFYHDRIQEAAYLLIPDDEKAHVHHRIGSLLLSDTPEADLPERIFDIVRHLNAGRVLVTGPAARTRAARLNLEAGRKAKAALAHEAALHHFQVGLQFLDEGAWTSQYELIYALHRELAEAEYLCSLFEQAEDHFDVLLEKAASRLEQVEIYCLKVRQYENLARYPEAIQAGVAGLALLGVALPGTAEEKAAAFEAERQEIQHRKGDRSIADLIHLPVMTDPAVKMSMGLLMALWSPAYIGGDTQLTWLIPAKMVRLSLEHGNTEASAHGYVVHGSTVAFGLKDFAEGYAYGRLAVAVNQQFDDRKLRAKVYHLFSAYINFWRMPLRTCLTYSKEAFRAGIESGDFPFATYDIFHESWYAFLLGDTLDQFIETYTPNLSFFARIKNQGFVDAQQVILHWGLCLQGRTRDRLSYTDDVFDEDAYLATYAGQPFFYTFFFFSKLQVCYTFEAYEAARALIPDAERVIPYQWGTIWNVILCFHEALTLAAVYAGADAGEQQGLSEKLAELEAKMKLWADNSPANFRHQHLLIAAERARVEGRPAEAMALYEEALPAAAASGFLQHEALANELYAKFYLARGNEKVAALYLAEAHRLYARWGALAKVADLEERYARLLPRGRPEAPLAETLGAEALDLATVVKAAQVISGEMERGRLLEKLMRIVIESAGAQKGLLLLDQDGQLVIEASGLADAESIAVLEAVPVDASPHLAAGIVHYVHRTGETVVAADAGRDGRFTGDAYIRDGAVRSVLCTPLRHQGKPVGMLYLENNLVSGAFTPDRIEVVRILASQAAISLENARLYAGAKQEMAERKRVETTLRAIIEGTAAETGDDFFRSLVQHLAVAFGVRYAFAAECTDAAKTRVRTLAFWQGDAHADNIAFALAGTPCEHVIGGAVCLHEDQVQARFPEDVGLVELGAESYLGIPFRDAAGNVLGHLAVLDDKPMQRTPEDMAILQIFAARAGAELERKRAEAALQRARDELELRVEERTLALSAANAHLTREIAERSEVERQLKEAKDAAEAANRAKSDFLANMSHELRTPLNAVLGYAQILKRDARLTEAQRAGLDVIERSGEHLLTLINDILDLSKIEAGKLEVTSAEFHLPDFLRTIADMARIRAEQKGLGFLYESLVPLPSLVSGDEQRLRQVLLNLLGNAVKFTERGGVAFKVDHLGGAPGAVWLRFQVEDTGVGIAPEDLEIIFEPFQQVGKATKHFEGTGLGLTISQRLVRLMGGTLHVESIPGQGSTFWVELELPAADDGRTAGAHEHVRPVAGFTGEPKTILVVDDKWENRSVLVNLLAPLGFTLVEAEHGQDALDKAAQCPPDLVLMDLVMPVLDGFEATRRLRRLPGCEETLVVALSASVFEHSRQQSREAGCVDFLQKPVRAPLLLDCLQKHLTLAWVYADAPAPQPEADAALPGATAPAAPAVVPPQASLQKLYELALMGHVQGLLAELDDIDAGDSACVPFTAPLRHLARDYDMKKIRDFLTSYVKLPA